MNKAPASISSADLSQTEDTSPSCSRATQAGAVCVSPAGASALPAFCGGLVNREMTLPAANQARNNVARGDGPRPRPRAPRACLRCITNLQLTQLFSFKLILKLRAFSKQGVRVLHTHPAAHSTGHRSGLIIFLKFGDECFSRQHQASD